MNTTIFKYALDMKALQAIALPNGAIIRKVGVQSGTIHIWAEVIPNETLVDVRRTFEIFPTGGLIPVDMGVERKYLDTVFIGSYVWHVYERLN